MYSFFFFFNQLHIILLYGLFVLYLTNLHKEGLKGPLWLHSAMEDTRGSGELEWRWGGGATSAPNKIYSHFIGPLTTGYSLWSYAVWHSRQGGQVWLQAPPPSPFTACFRPLVSVLSSFANQPVAGEAERDPARVLWLRIQAPWVCWQI